MGVDFRGRVLTAAELRARREARETKKHHKRSGRPRLTQVTSVSIPKHLKIRVELEIGEGSFSRGVVKACIAYLKEIDKDKEYRNE